MVKAPLLAVLAWAAFTAGSAVAPSPHITVTPSYGSSHTQFVVRFRAPLSTDGGDSRFEHYAVAASGPSERGCVSNTGTVVPPVAKGQLVTVRLDPGGQFHAWCRGAYHGTVTRTVRPACGFREICPMFIAVLPVGKFEFRVG